MDEIPKDIHTGNEMAALETPAGELDTPHLMSLDHDMEARLEDMSAAAMQMESKQGPSALDGLAAELERRRKAHVSSTTELLVAVHTGPVYWAIGMLVLVAQMGLLITLRVDVGSSERRMAAEYRAHPDAWRFAHFVTTEAAFLFLGYPISALVATVMLINVIDKHLEIIRRRTCPQGRNRCAMACFTAACLAVTCFVNKILIELLACAPDTTALLHRFFMAQLLANLDEIVAGQLRIPLDELNCPLYAAYKRRATREDIAADIGALSLLQRTFRWGQAPAQASAPRSACSMRGVKGKHICVVMFVAMYVILVALRALLLLFGERPH